jgi:hypothetical protein
LLILVALKSLFFLFQLLDISLFLDIQCRPGQVLGNPPGLSHAGSINSIGKLVAIIPSRAPGACQVILADRPIQLLMEILLDDFIITTGPNPLLGIYGQSHSYTTSMAVSLATWEDSSDFMLSVAESPT